MPKTVNITGTRTDTVQYEWRVDVPDNIPDNELQSYIEQHYECTGDTLSPTDCEDKPIDILLEEHVSGEGYMTSVELAPNP
jgi:hypothetical protein